MTPWVQPGSGINYTWTDIPAFDNKIEKLVASGRIGLQGKVWRVGGAFWVGTMYLDNNQTIAITLPSGTGIPALDGARTEVDQDSDHSFNFIFGGLWEINRRIQLAIEGGVGERNQLMVSVGHRF